MNNKISLALVFLLCAVAFLCSALGWAARALLIPIQEDTKSNNFAVTQAVHGILGRNLNLAATAERAVIGELTGKQSGTLTSIPVGQQRQINAGDILYTVDLEPIFVLQGDIPAFREMSTGTTGADVTQLQEYLFNEYGVDLVPDGDFGSVTESVVKKWQKDQKLEETGVIPEGQILFLPTLPAHIEWMDTARVGAELQSGVPLVKIFASTPTFSMQLPDGQLRATREGQEAVIRYQGYTWAALIGKITENPEDRTMVAELIPHTDQHSICGDTCDVIPVSGLKGLEASVVLIKEEEGTQVPITAIRVNKQGNTVVVDESGKQHPVVIRTNVGGQAIVDGIDPGMKIRMWADGSPAESISEIQSGEK